MLSPRPPPSRQSGPPSRRSPRSCGPTSISSELLRGPRPPLGSRADLDVDRVERLDVGSPDQGEEGPHSRSAGLAFADPLPPRPRTDGVRERLPPRRPRAYGAGISGGGGGRVGPRDRRVPPERRLGLARNIGGLLRLALRHAERSLPAPAARPQPRDSDPAPRWYRCGEGDSRPGSRSPRPVPSPGCAQAEHGTHP